MKSGAIHAQNAPCSSSRPRVRLDHRELHDQQRGWQIAGQDVVAFHTHGGPPARLGEARFRVLWQGPDPGALTVNRVEYLTGHDCQAPPTEVRSEPTFGGLYVEGMKQSARDLTVKGGTPLVVTVGFSEVDAYYTWCDRFAFRVTFRVGTATLSAIAETNVTREERSPEP